MDQPGMVEELKPYEAEVNAAIKNMDMVELRRIVEKAGLTWEDHTPAEKYMFDDENPPEICRVLIKASIPEHPKPITPEIEAEYWAAGERGDLDRCREIIEVYGSRWQCRYKTERCAGCPERHNNPAG